MQFARVLRHFDKHGDPVEIDGFLNGQALSNAQELSESDDGLVSDEPGAVLKFGEQNGQFAGVYFDIL